MIYFLPFLLSITGADKLASKSLREKERNSIRNDQSCIPSTVYVRIHVLILCLPQFRREEEDPPPSFLPGLYSNPTFIVYSVFFLSKNSV